MKNIKSIIYCFSGTGNSLYAALKIAESLKNSKVISMRNYAHQIPATDADIIGFIFPVYHWTMPTFVRNFIEQVDINPNAYIFGIASCGGVDVNALNDLEELMNAKNASLSYSVVHKNVASYVAAYKPFPQTEKILPKSKSELENIIQDIRGRKCNKPFRKSFLKEIMRFVETPFVKALPRKDKGFRVSSDCVSCGLCEKLCIARNIEMKNGHPQFKHKCTQCMACIVYCPKKAINYKNKTQKRNKYHHPSISAENLVTFNSEI